MRDPHYVPKPSRRPDGRGVIRLNGVDHYLGQAGDWPKGRRVPPPSIQGEYQALISRWLASGRQLLDPLGGLTVNELILAYDKWAEVYYQREGQENTQLRLIRDAVRVVKDLFGREPAASFGPKKLEAVQQAMMRLDWCRNYVNEQVNRVRRMFKWGVRQELVSGNVYHALQAVPGLRRGTPHVRESKPVRALAPAVIEATLPHVPPTVQAMVRVQLLSGARPGEVCTLRACDVDMSGPIWLYRPGRHKTAHHGHQRVIALGPQAQQIVRERLTLNVQAYLFCPRASEEARNAERRKNRKTPMTPSQARREPKKQPKRPKRERYDETSYRNAIYRACDKAFPPPAPLARREDETAKEWLARLTPEQREELRRWRLEHRWHPNQLRHTRATEVRRQYGLEAAQVVLGHAKADVTQVYAERNLGLAERIAAEIG
jgi:integrase